MKRRGAGRLRRPAPLRAAPYWFTVYAVDEAGNAQAKAATNRLTVRS